MGYGSRRFPGTKRIIVCENNYGRTSVSSFSTSPPIAMRFVPMPGFSVVIW
jgi:hypothetical protein